MRRAGIAILASALFVSPALLAQDKEPEVTLEELMDEFKKPKKIDCSKAKTFIEIAICSSKKPSVSGQLTIGSNGGSNSKQIDRILIEAKDLDLEKLSKMTPEELQTLSNMLEKAGSSGKKN